MMISLVFPVYNEEQNLEKLHAKISDIVGKISDTFEFIFVDDGSIDKTSEILRNLHARDPRVRIIRFSRNYGGHAALVAGLEYSKGSAAIALAADLQDPPQIISQLINKWKDNFNIVWAVRSDREGEKLSTKLFSRFYYYLINKLTPIRMPSLGSDVFLADRKVIDAYKGLSKKNSSVYMTIAWLGYSQAQIFYVKEARHKGRSGWTLRKKIKLLIDSLLSFSDVPIRFMSGLGIITAFLGFLYAIKVFWGYMNGSPVEGWSSLMVVILVIGGVQMIMLGLLGEYLWRTFDEARKRPQYVIEYVVD